VSDSPIFRGQRPELETLIAKLDVDFICLAECWVSPGWSLSFPSLPAPAIHYVLMGDGLISLDKGPDLDLGFGSLVVVPPRTQFRVQVRSQRPEGIRNLEADVDWEMSSSTFQRFVAGEGEPRLALICGYFRASYAGSIEPFGSLPCPIMERFHPSAGLEARMRDALEELNAKQVGMEAMTGALLKQVLISLLRRSFATAGLLEKRFPVLGDPQVARALADMLARPGGEHSVSHLARTAGLSRSSFMARFADAFGTSPMTALRNIRMRHAAEMLEADILSIEQIAHAVGYGSRSSFFRAFRQTFGHDPSTHRSRAGRTAERES
jgi:AraC-like DNA-binding protein